METQYSSGFLLVGVLKLAGGTYRGRGFACELDGRCLAAVPQQAWNRRAAGRVLPPGSLVKATEVEVVVSCGGGRWGAMTVWLGFLDSSRPWRRRQLPQQHGPCPLKPVPL